MLNNIKNGILKKNYFILLAVIISILIIITGIFYYKYEKKLILNEKQNTLQSIAELKINQLNSWRCERFSEAQFFSKDTTLIKNTKELLNNNSSLLKQYFINIFNPIKVNHNYEDIFIISKNGKMLFNFNDYYKTLDTKTLTFINDSQINNKIIFTDLYYCPLHKKIHYDIIAPISNINEGFIASLIIRIEPEEFLFPFIQAWPIPSKTAETLIVEKDNNDALFLNELRHLKNTALKLRIPLSQIDSPAVKAILGCEGITEGKDYRGQNVLADIHPVPFTPWYMVTKIDKNEIFSEIYFRLTIIIIMISIIILMSCLGLSWIYHFRQKIFSKRCS